MSSPVGEPVTPLSSDHIRPRHLDGRIVRLSPLNAARDAAQLYAASHGDAARDDIWTYKADEQPGTVEGMHRWLHHFEHMRDPLCLTVFRNDTKEAVGMVTYCNTVPNMRRTELGHIWYAPAVQRTNVNTESVYLMLKHAFDDLSYRRVEWKCDALNEKSRRAALRLGFVFEGVFRQHMIIKGRNRDTAWYAMMDHEWPMRRSNIERWLYNDDDSPSLSEMNNPG
jgi:RimJ/RimL family protein N-acetyltransferase